MFRLLGRRSAAPFMMCCVLVLPVCGAAAGEPAFRAEKLAERIHLFVPVDGASDRTNSLVVERQDGLLVIDAQPDPRAAGELLEAIAALSDLPVRFLVLSHPHAESAGGAGAFSDSAVIVVSEDALEAIEDPEYDFAAEMRETGGTGYSAPDRPNPQLVISGNAWLTDPHVPAQLLPLRQAHSQGGMLVRLPEQGLIYAGALLFHDRNPYAGDAHIGGWVSALNNISRLAPERVVALRGPAIDVLAVRRQRDALAWTRAQVETALVDGFGVDEVIPHVLQLESIEQHFDLEARPAFFRGVIEQVLAESILERKKRGR